MKASPAWLLSALAQIKAAGIMILPIFVASIISVALIAKVSRILARSRNRLEELYDWDGPIPKNRRDDIFSLLLVWLRKHPAASSEDKLRHAEALLGTLERPISWLNVIAAIAPLLGLLGTVFGMISNFSAVAVARPVSPLNQLSRGISEALLSTAGGLVVAIVSAVGHHALSNSLESFSDDIVYFLEERRTSSASGTAAEAGELVHP